MSIERDTIGASNSVYFVRLADRAECVIRVSPREWGEALAAQVWAMRECAARGVPVPELLAFETASRALPEPYLIMRRLPGVVATRAGLSDAARLAMEEQFGGYLARIHSITPLGFGALVPRDGAYAGRCSSLLAYLREELAARCAALPAEALPVEAADRVRGCLERRQGSFVLGTASLVHRDYQFRNVLVSGGAVTGILDFENQAAADPVMDLVALYGRGREADLQAVLRGYGPSPAFAGDFRGRLYAYALLGVLEALWWHWKLADRAAIAADHAELRSLEALLDG